MHRHGQRDDHTSSSFTPAAGMVPASLGIPKLNLPPQTFVEPLSATDAAAQFDDNDGDGNGDGDDPLDGLMDTKKKTYPPPRKPDPNKPARLGVAKLNAAKADLAERRAKAAALEIPRPKSASATAALGGWTPKMPWRLGHTGPKRTAPHTFGDHSPAAAADRLSLHDTALPHATVDGSDADGANGRSKSAPKAAWRLGHSAPKRGGRTFGATAAAQSSDTRPATTDAGIDGDDDDILGPSSSQPEVALKSSHPRPVTSLEAAASLLKARPRRDAKNPFSIDQQVKQQMQRFKAAVQTSEKGQARPVSAPIRTQTGSGSGGGSGGGIDEDADDGDQDVGDIDGLTSGESAHRGAPRAAWTVVTNANTAPLQTSTAEHHESDDDEWRRPWAERPSHGAAAADAATVNAREYIRSYMESKRSAASSASSNTTASLAASVAQTASQMPNLRPSLSAASVRGGTSEALEGRMRVREYMLKQREQGPTSSDNHSTSTALDSSAMFRDPYLDSANSNATSSSSSHAWAAPMHTPSKLASLSRIGFASTRTSPSQPASGESATDMLDRLRASIRLRASASAASNGANLGNNGAVTNSPPFATELATSESAIVPSLDFSSLEM